MKSRLFLISSLVLFLQLSAFGCADLGPIDPKWHWFFYTGYENADQEWQQKLNKAFREENITFWHNHVHQKVPREAVEAALYDVYVLNAQTDNAFFRYLIAHHDQEALLYWRLLKTDDSDYVHQAVWEQSIWYYSEKTGERYWWYDEEYTPTYDLSISKVEHLDESAIISCKNQDIRNRFLLQVMRKCFYARDYQGCVTLWERYGNKVPESVLRKQCLNYYGGALRRMDRDVEAAIIYASIGYYDPRLHYNIDVLRNIYGKDPNSQSFEFMVQQFVNTYFDYSCSKRYPLSFDYADPAGYQIPDTRQSAAFNELAEEILRDGKNRNPALWKSAQAALAYINGDTAAALKLIAEADKLRGTTATKDNIRMMRLVFNSTRSDNDANYEATLLPDLQWLVQNIEKEGFTDWWEYDLSGTNIDYQYSTTGLHRIKILRRTILLGIIPHFEKRGMAYKSMAYLNFYEEILTNDDIKKVRDFARRGLLRKGVDAYGYDVYFHPPIYREVALSEYEQNPDYETEGSKKTKLVADSITFQKSFDYSTLLFVYMDTTSIENVKRYLQFLRSGGKTAAEKFVVRHSYRDPSFYYELIATKYMRLEKYDSALLYLRKMDPDFPERQNIAEFINGGNRNPFAEGWISMKKQNANFGLSFNPAAEYEKKPSKTTFCQLMLKLRIMAESDPSAEIRAKAAYAYAVGYFRSSIGNAWALNYYEYGWNYGSHDGSGVPGGDKSIDADAHKRVDAWLDKALQYDDDEILTMKCTILHSEKKRALMKVEEVKHDCGGWCWTETVEEFLPIVRETFCDRGCDGDPLCTEEWRKSAWYY